MKSSRISCGVLIAGGLAACLGDGALDEAADESELAGAGLRGEYFQDQALATPVLARIDPQIDFAWAQGSPAPAIQADTFSVRWTGELEAAFTEAYSFHTLADDGARLWVDGRLLIDDWTVHAPIERTGTISLIAGRRYSVQLEYFDATGGATARLLWSSARQPKQVIPAARLFPAGVACSGANAALGSNIQSVINAAGDNATICIRPGVHRVTAPLAPRAGQTLQGDPGAVLNGSIVLASWTASGATWFATADLPEYSDPGQCDDDVQNLCRKREQLFRGGVHLQRVGRLADVGPGKFFQDYAANRTYVGDNPAGQLMEMSRTAYAIRSGAARVTVRGLTIEKFASPSQQGAIFVDSGADWDISRNRIQWNHASGIHTATAPRAHIHNNVILSNGQLGISQYQSHDVIVEDNEIAFNNTDGYYIADWESGGYKVTFSERGIAQFNRVHDNLGIGMWADIDNANLTFRHNAITNNAACGIRYEISRTGTLHDNQITGNGFGRKRNGADFSLFASAGININGSEGMTIHHNVVADNVNGIGLQMRCRNRPATPCVQPDWFLRDNQVHDNTITMRTGTRDGENASGLGVLGTFTDSQTYYTGQNNRFFNNTYRLDTLARERFLFRNASGNRDYMTGAAFKAAGQEVGGQFVLAP